MAVMLQPRPLPLPSLFLFFVLFFISAIIPFSHCQFGHPQNIETFYPNLEPSSPAPPPSSPNNPSTISSLPPSLPPPPPPPEKTSSSSSTRSKIAKAVGVTAACTLVVCGIFFLLIHRRVAAKRKRVEIEGGGGTNWNEGRPAVAAGNEFSRFDGDVKGFIVDENGLDVLYWRKLEGRNSKKSFKKEVFANLKNEEQEGIVVNENRQRKSQAIQEIPLLRGKSSTSQSIIEQEVNDLNRTSGIVIKDVDDKRDEIELKAEPESLIQQSTPPPPPSPTPTPTPTPAPTPKPLPLPPSLAFSVAKSPAQPPPPPPPPLPTPAKKSPMPPAPPPPPKAGGLKSSSNLPPAPKLNPDDNKQGESSSGTGNGQVKMKPLHWDKVNTNTDHSMVWDKIDGGSFRFDGDLMEALFGYVATNRKSPQRNNNSIDQSNRKAQIPAQVFILDPKKSQNIAIVVKSLAISREEIVDALIEGQGLNADAIEKLARVAPTEEEQSKILGFDGDPTKLAAAEAFLYHLLNAVPSTFTRLNAMLFRSNYDSEILHVKKSIQTLELGCKELRTRGLFMKLLEAILKAGNRMNAGTNRGNAEAFNLNALRKLSDVKSMDGKTTLLHFVVEEVVRSEGKRCVLNRNRSMSRSSSRSSNNSSNSESLTIKVEREKEYKMIGLPIIGGLSAEFSNVKKAATVDYDTFSSTSSALTARTAEIRALVSQCDNDRRGGGFVREMKGFLEAAEEELRVVREEQTRVMKLVQKTTEYYQAGASKDKRPLQLFVIVKDFLDMVDRVCIEIARNLQRKKTATTSGSSSPKSPPSRTTVRFPNLPENFMSEKSRSSSSESDDF